MWSHSRPYCDKLVWTCPVYGWCGAQFTVHILFQYQKVQSHTSSLHVNHCKDQFIKEEEIKDNNRIQTEPHGYPNSHSWKKTCSSCYCKIDVFCICCVVWVWKWYVVSWGLNREECAKAVANSNHCRWCMVEFSSSVNPSAVWYERGTEAYRSWLTAYDDLMFAERVWRQL